MEFPKWKKTLKNILTGIGRLSGVSKNVALSASLLALHSGQSAAGPRVPLNELTTASIPGREIKKYSAKYLLKSAVNSRFVTRLIQHRSHSSHSSHRSHSSHASHSSHYSSTGGAPSIRVPVPAAPSSPAPRVMSPVEPVFGFRDNFIDLAQSLNQWRIGAPTIEASSVDESVSLAQRSGRLEITPRSGIAGRHYNGYFSRIDWNLTGARAAIEIAQTPAVGASMIFALASDADNWYGFVLEDGVLHFQSKINGVKTPKVTPYKASQHHWWRFRHDVLANLLFWETSSDGITWKVLNAETPQISMTGVYISLAAGTSKVTKEAGTAAFTNFQLSRAY